MPSMLQFAKNSTAKMGDFSKNDRKRINDTFGSFFEKRPFAEAVFCKGGL